MIAKKTHSAITDPSCKVRTPQDKLVMRLILIQLFVLVITCIATLKSNYQDYHVGDIVYYYRASLNVMLGHLPYRDFAFAYPPFSIIPFTLPQVLGLGLPLRISTYTLSFLLESMILTTSIALVLWKIARQEILSNKLVTILGTYTVLVCVSSPLLPWRFDLCPVLLTLLSFQALTRNRAGVSGIWLGLGIAAKLYPVVLLPVFSLYLWTLGKRREVAWLNATCVAAVIVCFLPFAHALPSTLSFLTFHEKRGLEIESLPAGIILLGQAAHLISVSLTMNYGAEHLVAAGANTIIRFLPLVFAALYFFVLVRCNAQFRHDKNHCGKVSVESLAIFSIGSIAAFILANKVFSTSYIFWFLPFIPFLDKRERIMAVIMYVLTIAIYPFAFSNLMLFQLPAIILLNVRNLLLVFWFGLLLRKRYQLSQAALTSQAETSAEPSRSITCATEFG